MPFPLAKALTLLSQPSFLAVVAIAAGLVLIGRGARARLGYRLAWGGLLYIVVAGFSPLGNLLILPLEERFPVPRISDADKVAGIIVLGGFEDGWVSAGRGGLGVNESADRLTETLRLALKHPEAKIVFTGGVGTVWRRSVEATGPVSLFLADAGIGRDRLVLEGRSRNTLENALFTRELVEPKPGELWLLVTSAYHMPRAMALFRRAGFDVTAFPVDFKTRGPEDVTRLFERIPGGLSRTETALNEWLGLFIYRALGRSDELLPGP